MANKVTLKHKLPCGTVQTRTTARTYTHVVVGRRDPLKIRQERARIFDVDLRNFEFYAALVAIGAGGQYRHSNGLAITIKQGDYEEALQAISGCDTAQAYAEKVRDQRLAAHDLEADAGKLSAWFIVGWCGRQELADKLAARERSTGWCWHVVMPVEINHGEMPVPQKIPRREYLLEGRALAAAFVVAQANWPGVELGYTGTDPKTFRHYFQEWGNPAPFVL